MDELRSTYRQPPPSCSDEPQRIQQEDDEEKEELVFIYLVKDGGPRRVSDTVWANQPQGSWSAREVATAQAYKSYLGSAAIQPVPQPPASIQWPLVPLMRMLYHCQRHSLPVFNNGGGKVLP
jgi:hypothetical protein